MIPEAEALALLACPRCRGRLDSDGQSLACKGCSVRFDCSGLIPDLLPWAGGQPDPSWSVWRERLETLQRWREQTWGGSAAASPRRQIADDLTTEFFRFARIPESGVVLEIGCGDGGMRRHIPRRRFLGIDPLAGLPGSPALPDPQPGLWFARGVGERLPLASGMFDAVILAEMLDHANDPAEVLAEAHRVLKDGGVLAVMQSVSLARPRPPLHVRLRVVAGHWKARLMGRKRPIGDLETKVRVLGQDECAALAGALFMVDSGITSGSTLFLRALKQDLAAPRPPKRSV